MAAPGDPPERRMDISFDLQVRHDSNVARADSIRAAQRGLHRSDQRLTPSITADIATPLGSHSFGLQGSVGYDFYNHNSQLNRERLALESQLGLNLPVCDTTLTAGISRRQSDLGEVGQLPGVTGTDSVKNAETSKSVGASFSCGGAFGLRPIASVGYTDARNSNSARDLTDYDSFSYSGGVGYVHPSIGELELFVRRAETRFPNQPRLIGGGKDGYNVMSYGGRFSRSIGSRLRGSVELSYTDLNPRGPIANDFNGLNWAVELDAQISQRLLIHSALSRSIVSTLTVDSAYHVDTLYLIDASYAINERLTLKTGFSHLPRRYYNGQTTFGPALTKDHQNVGYATLVYAFSPKINFSFDIGRETRNANGNFYDYKNTRASVGVSYKF